MISFLSKLHAIDALKPSFNPSRIQINTSLAFEIKVIRHLFANRYELEVGNHKVETKSTLPLEVGKKYWGQMRESKGVVQLHHLLKKPAYLQEKPPLIFKNFDFMVLKNLPMFKERLLEGLTTANQKEFRFIADILLGMHHAVVTVPFEYRNRYALFQYKNANKMSITKNSLQFYAEFVNLGPIGGHLLTARGYKELQLEVYFENSAKYLKGQIKELGFDNVSIKVTQPQVLHNLNSSLLDMKG